MSTAEPHPDESSGVSRRVLIGSGLLVLGAVGGGVVGFVRTDPPRQVVADPVPPADVLAAIGREQALLAAYDAALAAGPNALWSTLRAEHAAHLAALTALVPAEVSASTTPTAAPTRSAPGAADLLAAERAAAGAARTACLAGNGTAAVLLACIAASESSHAAVLA